MKLKRAIITSGLISLISMCSMMSFAAGTGAPTTTTSDSMNVPKVTSATVKTKAPATSTQSTSVSSAQWATLDAIPCPTPLVCPDINGVLPSGVKLTAAQLAAYGQGAASPCPDVCSVTRKDYNASGVQIAIGSADPKSTKEAICPAGYSQIGSYNAQKEYGQDKRDYDEGWPIPDYNTYGTYVGAGDSCGETTPKSPYPTVLADNIMVPGACGHGWEERPHYWDNWLWSWTGRDNCQRWHTSPPGCTVYGMPCPDVCDAYWIDFQPLSRLGSMSTAPAQYTGISDDNKSYSGVGQISTWSSGSTYACDLDSNKGGNNPYSASPRLCGGKGNNNFYYTLDSTSDPRYIAQGYKSRLIANGCYATWVGDDCTHDGVWCGVAHNQRWNAVVTYTKCHHYPGQGLSYTGMQTNATLICGRVKPTWN